MRVNITNGLAHTRANIIYETELGGGRETKLLKFEGKKCFPFIKKKNIFPWVKILERKDSWKILLPSLKNSPFYFYPLCFIFKLKCKRGGKKKFE